MSQYSTGVTLDPDPEKSSKDFSNCSPGERARASITCQGKIAKADACISCRYRSLSDNTFTRKHYTFCQWDSHFFLKNPAIQGLNFFYVQTAAAIYVFVKFLQASTIKTAAVQGFSFLPTREAFESCSREISLSTTCNRSRQTFRV